jgi:DNA-binding winged helix-turn-helix (wHTH) protein/TolB-like protein
MDLRRRALRLGEYEFDLDTGELVSPAGTVRLQPQPAKVLAALLARPGELVTREELKRTVWPDTVVEADQGLNFCIRQIRAALGDEADRGRFIETLPRRGYRIVAPVQSVEQVTAAPQEVPKPVARYTRGSIALAAIVLVTVIGAFFLPRSRSDQPAPERTVRLAILPFVAPAAERWMIDLNDDLVDQLVAQLTLLDSGRIGVVGPVTTRRYAGYPGPHAALGAALGVDAVLSGGIRSTDSTLFVQAIRVTDGAHVVVWREKVFQRSAEEIARSIIAATRGKL